MGCGGITTFLKLVSCAYLSLFAWVLKQLICTFLQELFGFYLINNILVKLRECLFFFAPYMAPVTHIQVLQLIVITNYILNFMHLWYHGQANRLDLYKQRDEVKAKTATTVSNGKK